MTRELIDFDSDQTVPATCWKITLTDGTNYWADDYRTTLDEIVMSGSWATYTAPLDMVADIEVV